MAPQPAATPDEARFEEDDDDYVDPAVVASVQADVDAALEFLCAHAGDWPGGRSVAARIRRHRRRNTEAEATRRAG